jgi:acetylglutamate kinase
VIKIGGRVQADAWLPGALVRAQRAGAGIVVVHGGGDDISDLQRRLGHEPRFVGGRRATSPEELDIVRMVLSGRVNKRLVAVLFGAGARAVGVSGEDGGLLRAHAAAGAPLGRVGERVEVDPSLVRDLLAHGWMPVVSPLARDADASDGAGLNVNGDDAAAALAAALEADELLFVADVPGVLINGIAIPRLGADDAASLISGGEATGGMAAKLQAGCSAMARGVRRVRIAGLAALDDDTTGTTLHPSATAVSWRQ